MLNANAKLQNLKAIHNGCCLSLTSMLAECECKITKSESNSQPFTVAGAGAESWMRMQNYKIWKQFTTRSPPLASVTSWMRMQNYKIWKQFTTQWFNIPNLLSWMRMQNYKIWKQFTTTPVGMRLVSMLNANAKLQNLKAIHNRIGASVSVRNAECECKITKSESNSQPFRPSS